MQEDSPELHSYLLDNSSHTSPFVIYQGKGLLSMHKDNSMLLGEYHMFYYHNHILPSNILVIHYSLHIQILLSLHTLQLQRINSTECLYNFYSQLDHFPIPYLLIYLHIIHVPSYIRCYLLLLLLTTLLLFIDSMLYIIITN